MNDDDLIEPVCRVMCEADGVDPDKEGYGLGVQMPQGERYPLWKSRERAAHMVLKFLRRKMRDYDDLVKLGLSND